MDEVHPTVVSIEPAKTSMIGIDWLEDADSEPLNTLPASRE